MYAMVGSRIFNIALALCMAWPAAVAHATTEAKSSKSGGLAGLYLSARHAEAVSHDTRATTFLSRILALDPDNQDIRRHTYFLAAQIGDFRTAAATAAQAIDGTPQLSLALLIVAVKNFKEEKYKNAWSSLDAISTQSAVGFALPLLRAWGMAPLQPAEPALAELAALKGMSGTGDLYNAMAGMLNEYYGREQQARAHYDLLAARGQQIPPAILRLVTDGYQRLGEKEKAQALIAAFAETHGASLFIENFTDALKVSPGTGKISAADGMAEALFASCQMLLQSVRSSFGIQLAVVHGQAALFLKSDMLVARRIVAAALSGRERYGEANTVLAPVKKKDTGYAPIKLQMAENFERMDRPADALALMKEVTRHRPDWPDVHIAMGDHLRRAEDFVGAAAAYDRAFQLLPEQETKTWQLYYARGIALERTNRWDRANQDFRTALNLKPDEASVLNYLGYSLIDRGLDIAEGRGLIEKAFELEPDDGYIVDSLGWVMYLMGETQNAVDYLERAVETVPADPTINDHLGDAYWRAGRRQEAHFQWRRALTLDPKADQRTQIRKKMEQGLARN